MRHRRIIHQEEQDAYTRWRRVLYWRPGARKQVKHRTNRRERREGRVETREVE